MPRFLLMAVAVGLIAVGATLLLGEEVTRSLGYSTDGAIEFVTPFHYAPLASLDGEVVTLRNAGDEPIDLSGWTLANESGGSYTFPDGFSLAPGDQVAVHTGRGEDTATDLYWRLRAPVWSDKGGTAILTTPDGEIAAAFSYGGCATCSI